MEFKQLMNKHNLTIKQISDKFVIPYRTVQNWAGDVRKCPDYIIKMIDTILKYEKEKGEA